MLKTGAQTLAQTQALHLKQEAWSPGYEPLQNSKPSFF